MMDNGTNFPYEKLFEPFHIKNVRLRNRIVFPAVYTNFGTNEGCVSRGSIAFHEARAAHVGTHVVEATLVRPMGGIGENQLRAYDDRYIPGLAKLCRAIKAKGAAAVLQLADMGLKAGFAGIKSDPVAPSKTVIGPLKARALDPDEIREVVRAFGEAAQRAHAAGFDGVEIHAAHLYLISEFLSPVYNKRTDAYGGSIHNRTRFLIEIIDAVKNRAPDDFLVFCRINTFENFEGGMGMEDVKTISKLVEAAGVDVLSLSGICRKIIIQKEGKDYEWDTSTFPRDWPEGNAIKYAIEIKNSVKIPTIAVGKIFSPQLAENILQLGQADLIATARTLIADPEFPKKILEGREDEIARCKEDGRCLRCLGLGKPMSCVMDRSLPPENIEIPA